MITQTRKPVKAILFDKDGTLIAFNETWGALYGKLALEVANQDPDQAQRLLEIGGFDHGSGTFAAGSVLAAGTTPEIVRLWLPNATSSLRAQWSVRLNQAFVEEGPRAAVAVVDLEKTLITLHASGIKLAITTNDLEQAAENTIQRFGLRHLFCAIIGYDSVADPKPAAGPVLKFCRDQECDPNEVLVIGDNTHDIQMARSANAGYAIGVLTGTGTYDDLIEGSDAVLNSIADLPNWLGLG